jgi:hypothetical protein
VPSRAWARAFERRGKTDSQPAVAEGLADALSTGFAGVGRMDSISPLGRVALAILGLVLIVVGLAMTATIVMLPVGLLTFLVGITTFVAAIFAHDDRPA